MRAERERTPPRKYLCGVMRCVHACGSKAEEAQREVREVEGGGESGKEKRDFPLAFDGGD